MGKIGSIFLGAVPDSGAWQVNLKDIVAGLRKMLASAFWQAATLFVVTMLAGIQHYVEQKWGVFASFIGVASVIEGLVKVWGRFVKDYSGEAIGEAELKNIGTL